MNKTDESRARRLVETLERAGANHGLLVVGGTVVIRNGPGESDSPAMFEPADLNNAIELGLLQENQVSGSVSWKWWVLRPARFLVTGFTKIAGGDPPQFQIALRDLENTNPSYICRTEAGTEEVLREVLAKGGMDQQEIDRLFFRAK